MNTTPNYFKGAPDPNAAGALSYAKQLAQGLRTTLGIETPLNLGNFQQLGQAARVFNGQVMPQIGGIPQGPVDLKGLQGTLANIQSAYKLKIPGSTTGTSSQNLQAILSDANKPISPQEAYYQSLNFMQSIVQENLKRATSGDNYDAQELEKLQQDIDAIKESSAKGA